VVAASLLHSKPPWPGYTTLSHPANLPIAGVLLRSPAISLPLLLVQNRVLAQDYPKPAPMGFWCRTETFSAKPTFGAKPHGPYLAGLALKYSPSPQPDSWCKAALTKFLPFS
jgi:hypothetical protein